MNKVKNGKNERMKRGLSLEPKSKKSAHVRPPFLVFLPFNSTHPFSSLSSFLFAIITPAMDLAASPSSPQQSVFVLFERYDFDHDPTFQVHPSMRNACPIASLSLSLFSFPPLFKKTNRGF